MLNLVRGSCKVVTFETQDLSKLINFVSTQFKVLNQGPYSAERMNAMFAESQEGHTIILITDEMKETITHDDILYIMLLNIELENILASITNNAIGNPIISHIKLSPRLLILRTVGDVEKVIEEVVKDTSGTVMDAEEARNSVGMGTLIYFSNNALHKPIELMKTYNKCIHTTGSYYKVLRFLRNQNLKYLNIGIDNTDWYELKIKIYDAYGHFNLHYERMRYVLEKLELGMILGETWGTDMAAIFQSVGIYKVRFFTFKNPLEIKKILVGLEYLADGERIVDYDLYAKRKKLHWDQVRTEDVKGKTELGVYYRNIVLSHLSDHEKERIEEMEKEILKSKQGDYKKMPTQ
jgi:hypothetical protein